MDSGSITLIIIIIVDDDGVEADEFFRFCMKKESEREREKRSMKNGTTGKEANGTTFRSEDPCVTVCSILL